MQRLRRNFEPAFEPAADSHLQSLTLQWTRVDIGADDEKGALVFADDRLVAIFVRLDGSYNEQHRGQWFLETGFGDCAEAQPPFGTLEKGLDWVAHACDDSRSSASELMTVQARDALTRMESGVDVWTAQTASC